MSNNKETNQKPEYNRKRIDRTVRMALLGAIASSPFGLGITAPVAHAESTSSYTPKAIETSKSSTLEEGIPSEVVTPKDIHPVTNWVTQLPNEEITIPAGMTLQVLGTDHGLYVVAYGGEEHLVPKTLVEVKSSEDSVETSETEQETGKNDQEVPITSQELVTNTASSGNTNIITNTETITPTVERSPKVIIIVGAEVANVRSSATTTENNIITQVKQGEEYEATGEVVRDDNSVIVWREILIPDPENSDKDIKAWIHSSVIDSITTLPEEETSPGVGGVVGPQSSETTSDTETNFPEMSQEQKTMDYLLPEDFRTYFESLGANVEWNQDHEMYEVKILTEGVNRTYLLIPESSAQRTEQADLEHGLYYLGEKATVSNTFTNEEGNEVTQTFHFLVSPEFPQGSENGILDENFSLANSEVVVNDYFREHSEETVAIYRELFGLPKDKNFELYFVFSGQDMADYDDEADDRKIQERGMFSGSAEHKSTFLRLGDKWFAIYYTDLSIDGKKYKERPHRFGAGVASRAIERMFVDTPFINNQEAFEKFSDLDSTMEFYNPIADKIDEMSREAQSVPFEVIVPPDTLQDFLNNLN